MNLASINQSIANLETALQTVTANPQPNYTIDGESVSLADYLKSLTDGLQELYRIKNQASPYVTRSLKRM